MAQSHKRRDKRPNFSNGKKWAEMQRQNLKVLKEAK